MTLFNSTTIIADDLTGANDTALQYFSMGCKSKIIIDINKNIEEENDEVWAISTESRNATKEAALDRICTVYDKLKDSSKGENFYKKIDSTLRGNTGLEIVALLEATNKDVAIVAPAYIEESRATIGGYQLLNGIPIERTQCALDPKSPIYDSYIPDILKKDINPELHSLIGTIELNTVVKGALAIALKINELVQKGKKILVVDAMSTVDLDQIALAIEKSQYDILPCGSAGLANAISKNIDNIEKNTHINSMPNYPRLILSGSATSLTKQQIEKLKEEKKDIFYVDLMTEDVIEEINMEKIEEISEKLSSGIDVCIHSSFIKQELEKEESASDQLIDAGIAKNEFSSKITDYLSDVLYEINQRAKFILIMIGGETSYKCAMKIDSSYLQILDAIRPAIPLCIDSNGKIITTKSGNFGTNTTLVEIIDYFDGFKNEKV